MVFTEDLTDSEIRLQLTKLGYPVGPITTTTRKVLLKKLKYLLEQSKLPVDDSKNSKSRVSLSSFSSGEDSEDDVKVNNRKSMPPPPTPNKRKSVGRSKQSDIDNNYSLNVSSLNNDLDLGLIPSASSTLTLKESPIKNKKSLPLNRNNSSDRPKYSPPGSRNYHSPSNTYTQPKSHVSENVISVSDPFDTGSDSDLGNEETTNSWKKRSGAFISSSKLQDSGSIHASPVEYGSSQNTRPRFQSLSRMTKFYNSSTNNQNLGHSSQNDEGSVFSPSEPFSSDFVRKLCSKTSNKANRGITSRLEDVKESDDEDLSSNRHFSRYSPISSRLQRDVASSPESGPTWKITSFIPMTLILFCVIFFGAIIIIYLNVTFNDGPVGKSDVNLPICRTDGKAGVECILDAEITFAMNLFQELYHDLLKHALSVKCGMSTEETTELSDNQLIQIIVEKKEGMNVWEVEKQLRNVKVLIKANPNWGVEITDTGLDIPSPTLPATCSLLNSGYWILGYFMRLTAVVAAIYMTVKIIRWWMARHEHNKKEMFHLVESVIELLSNHQQSGGDNFLAINHVRDQLIPPHERQKMAKIWNQAVAYLNENDSRIRVEIQQVAGEDFHVWQWLPSPKPNGKRKVWQGQAFETMEGSVNSLPVSPTPCLKIRHMFEPDVEVEEDWVIRVQDAILEKCEGIKVLHIAVDKNSQEGCVYVKCSSPEEAGRAYRGLHGSWFDSKLVTVKYLRLERYYERFPDAVQATQPLQPSNDRKLSLQ